MKLDKLGPDCYYFVKEALALRGIADVIGCYRGVFFAWELKRSERAAKQNRDGYELQKYNLERVKAAKGIGRVVYPENIDECMVELMTAASPRA
jgi:hypothetical protein